jgi:hypothetical protein
MTTGTKQANINRFPRVCLFMNSPPFFPLFFKIKTKTEQEETAYDKDK